MSDAYTLEAQNNALLASLSTKVSALRGVTVDIYDQARDHSLLERNQDAFGSMTSQLRGSGTRLARMAQQGGRLAVCRLAAIFVAAGVLIYLLLAWLFGRGGKR